MRKTEKMHRAQHYITQRQRVSLEVLSQETGIGLSDHMRRAIDQYLATPAVQRVFGELTAKI